MANMALEDPALFKQVFVQLQKHKLLKISKLAVMDPSLLPDVIRMAAGRDLEEEEADGLLRWLEDERVAAVAAQHLVTPGEIEDWALERYRYAEQLRKAAKNQSMADAQKAYSMAKRARIDPLCAGQGRAITGRASDDQRIYRDAEARSRWANKALGILMKTGWFPTEDFYKEGEFQRFLTRLQKGLRASTIKQRA